MGTPDMLLNLRNLFYLGAYQAAINNSDVPGGLDAAAAAERDVIVFRSYIALGSYQLVISEIDSSAATSLQAVKLHALYLTGDKEGAISSLKERLSDSAIGSNPVLRLIAGIIFMHEQDYNEALKHTLSGGTLDLHALNVEIFIKMHRLDNAEEELMIMYQIDKDHTLTHLAKAWLDMAVGGSKFREAYWRFKDFSDKYPMTGTSLDMDLSGAVVALLDEWNASKSMRKASEEERQNDVVFTDKVSESEDSTVDIDINISTKKEQESSKELIMAKAQGKMCTKRTVSLDKDVEIRQQIERAKIAEAKFNETFKKLKESTDRELMYCRKAAILAKEMKDEEARHAAAMNDLKVKAEEKLNKELQKKSVEMPIDPDRDKKNEAIRMHMKEGIIQKKKFNPDGSLKLDFDLAIDRCHDIFICPSEVSHISLREHLAKPDAKIFRVCRVPGRVDTYHRPEDETRMKTKKYVIPQRRKENEESPQLEPVLRKMTPLGKFVVAGIVDCAYKLQRLGLSLNGKITLDSFRLTANKKIKLDASLKSHLGIRTPHNMKADYAALPSVISEIVSLYSDGFPIPFDLKHIVDLLEGDDPVANEVIIRFNASLMDEIQKRDHFIIMYNRLELMEKEDEQMEKQLEKKNGKRGTKLSRSDKVMMFILAAQKDAETDWRDRLHCNEFVAMVRNGRQVASRHQHKTEARKLLETWRHNFTHLHEYGAVDFQDQGEVDSRDSVSRSAFQDKDEVDIMDSVSPGVINQFQEGMHSIGQLDVPHLVATMKV